MRSLPHPIALAAVALAMIGIAPVAGCNDNKAKAPAAEGMPPSNLPPLPAGQAATARGAGTAPGAPSAATTAPGLGAPDTQLISGKLLEKIEAPSYSYLRIGTASGEVWAAVPTATATVGQPISVHSQMVMNDFESKALNRKFDRLVFGTLGDDAPAAPAPAAAAAAPPMGGSPKSTVPADIGDVKVDKATGEGARTIAETWAQKAALANKPVRVRGKVVKYTAQVMGKNWVHVRDGSGSDAAGNNDLTATTTDEAKVGDVVTIAGTVHTDRDFGAGYTYAVIVEDAKLAK